MKKTLLVLLFLVASPAFATSGACSDHGGVDCSISGVYATCNDGSQSSVLYDDMEECQSQCELPTPKGCIQQSDYDSLEQQCEYAKSLNDDDPLVLQSCYQLPSCQAQIDTYQDGMQIAEMCFHSEAQAIDSANKQADEELAQMAKSPKTQPSTIVQPVITPTKVKILAPITTVSTSTITASSSWSWLPTVAPVVTPKQSFWQKIVNFFIHLF